MKLFRYACIVLSSVMVLPLTSCDKVQDLVGKAKGLVSGDEEGKSEGTPTAEVLSVDEARGKEIISSESRMVVVEFYSDT